MIYIEIKDWSVKLDMNETYRMKILPTEKFLNILKDKRVAKKFQNFDFVLLLSLKISLFAYCAPVNSG